MSLDGLIRTWPDMPTVCEKYSKPIDRNPQKGLCSFQLSAPRQLLGHVKKRDWTVAKRMLTNQKTWRNGLVRLGSAGVGSTSSIDAVTNIYSLLLTFSELNRSQ